jgi:hypothetical protein
VILSTTIPIRTVNEANGSHGHWSAKAKRRKSQRSGVLLALNAADGGVHGRASVAVGAALTPMLAGPGLTITLTRTAPSNGLDDDALPLSLKSIRDGVADWLGLADDRDPRLTWRYQQERGAWGVRIEITERAKEAA